MEFEILNWRIKLIPVVLFVYTLLALLTLFLFDGTGDSGDSILHYLYAKYAPKHPELFFDHWAKPLYVLLASPFAQFGFIGLKVFNVIASVFTLYFTFRICEILQLKNAWVVTLLLICSPLNFVLTFSGLTEPLFAFLLCLSLYMQLRQNQMTAAIIISFLPFVRSEGLIIIGIFAIYYLFKKQWRFLPSLLFGHLFYSIAGYFVHHDLFWVFAKIPYAHLSSQYGHGDLFHFTVELIFITGLPIYILFWMGCLNLGWKTLTGKINLEISVLVFLSFLSFLIAHSLFWYLGIFNSMGLKRVLVGVMPLIAIISLFGFNFIFEEFWVKRENLKIAIIFLLLVYIIIFPFTANNAAINWDKEMRLSNDQKSAKRLAEFIKQNNKTDHGIYYAHPYLSEALQIDHFDNKKHQHLNLGALKQIKKGELILWENWYALTEGGITKENLDLDPRLRRIYHFSVNDYGREIIYAAYELK